MRAAFSLVVGVLGCVFGGVVATALVAALITAVGATGDPRGGDTVFKIAWSAIVFAIGPLAAATLPLVIVRGPVEPRTLAAIIIALGLYGITAWALAPMLSAGNDCMVGVTWPVSSVGGCD